MLCSPDGDALYCLWSHACENRVRRGSTGLLARDPNPGLSRTRRGSGQPDPPTQICVAPATLRRFSPGNRESWRPHLSNIQRTGLSNIQKTSRFKWTIYVLAESIRVSDPHVDAERDLTVIPSYTILRYVLQPIERQYELA